jgi:hypothetical protein
MAAEAAARFLAEMGGDDDDDDAIYGKGESGEGATPVSANAMVLEDDDSDEVTCPTSQQIDALISLHWLNYASDTLNRTLKSSWTAMQRGLLRNRKRQCRWSTSRQSLRFLNRQRVWFQLLGRLVG